jgi:uncharacterized protein YcbK (DUF882 family)
MSDLALSGDSRRRFLGSCAKLSTLAAGAPLISAAGAAAAAELTGPTIPMWPGARDVRQIWIQRRETGESAVLRYFDGADMVMPHYARACEILRDVQAGQITNIDVDLLDLMFAMQRWLVSWGIDRPLVISSGFRTRATNAHTEGAAKSSMHLLGRAADITMPGVPPEYLGRLAAIFVRGGVGFYVDRGFVHIDTGRVRYWADGRASRRSR